MRERVDSTNSLILDIPGYADAEADIVIPRQLLESMGLNENLPILLRFDGEGTGHITVVGQAGDIPSADPDLILARPDLPHGSDYPPVFVFSTPTAWMETHRVKSGDVTNDWDENLYGGVHEGFDLEQFRQFLRPDGSLVIPA
jgi:hypothetical protein